MARVHLSIGMRCIKYSLFGFNIFFFIAGILLLILGGVAATLGIGGSIIDLPQVAIGIIVLGVIVIILAFFGCCGARKERRSLLTIYFIILLMIFIVQFSLGIASIAYGGRVSDAVTEGWNRVNNNTRSQIQTTFDCCGLNGTEPECAGSGKRNCHDTLVEYFEGKLRIVQVTSLTICALEVVGLVFTCCLCHAISRSQRKHTA